MTTSAQLAGLLAAYSQGKFSLSELLTKLNQRGAMSAEQHAADLSTIQHAAKSGLLDERIQRLVVGKLQQLQSGATTQIAPPVPPSADVTALNPAPAPASDDDAILDLSIPGAVDRQNEKTQITGQRDGHTTFTPKDPRSTSGPNTGSSRSGISQSSWERLASTDTPDRDVISGDVLKGRFYLEKELGRGGMGVVFKARDERKVEAQDRNPWIAVKVLNDEFRRHPQSLIALQREARKAQQLTHDNVLRVFDFDKDGSIVYITMEYVDGGTLKDFLKGFKKGLPFAEAQPIIEGLARGLGRAHRDGIVHSDFKPGNVMITTDRIPKIFDLGIARAAQTGTDANKQTGETTVFDAATLGALTPAYASLEMLRGESPQIPDDIYALGITVYELLTGSHPFKKQNAEQALNEGLKPASIPGLTRRQWRTIEKALAFRREDRLQTAEELIEGLRPRTFRDLALPIAASAVSVILLAAILLGPVRSYFKEQRITQLVNRFEQSQFTEMDEAVRELGGLSAAERDATLQKSAGPIQDYFFKLAAEQWDPDQGRYRYLQALAILKAVDTLYGQDSRRVSEYLARIEAEKNQTLSGLNDQYAQRLASGRLFSNEAQSAAETLAQVRQIDPQHSLLKDSRLLLAYVTAVRQSLQAGNQALAEKRIGLALQDYPDADSLRSLQADITAMRDAQIMRAQMQEQMKRMADMSPGEARAQLAQLVEKPLFTPEWQGLVEGCLSRLKGDASPDFGRLKQALADAYAQQIAAKVAEKSFTAARLVADRGLQLFPGMPRLSQEKTRLDEARKAFELEQVGLTAAAETDGLKQTLLTRASANDLRKAELTFGELKKRLPVTDAFLVDTAPRAIGEAYLRQAERLAAQEKFGEALRLVTAGAKLAPMLDSLVAAATNYGLEARVAELQSALSRPAAINGDQLRVAASHVRSEDPKRYAKLSDDLLKKLTALAGNDPASARQAKGEWIKVYPDNSALAALSIVDGPAPVTSTPVAPEDDRKTTEQKKPTETASAESAIARPEVDPCKLEYAGFGSKKAGTCVDALANGAEGPRLVVVPGMSGEAPYAIGKFEITNDQFNAYCRASGQCSTGEGSGKQPRLGMSFNQAKAYAAWLTRMSGFTYRVPTEAEWAHAATAQGAGSGDDFNCVLMQGAQQIKGGVPIAVSVGNGNPWGLVNVVGNAAEWVDSAQGPALRGGNFNVQMTQCSAEWRETGTAGGAAGVRLVRELDAKS